LFYILEINHKGEEHGAWEIWYPLLTSVEFSDVDYDGNQFATIDLTFSYKNFYYDQNWGQRQLTSRVDSIEKNVGTDWTDKLTKAHDWWSGGVGGWLGVPKNTQFNPKINSTSDIKTG
jgi:hypothetical protein